MYPVELRGPRVVLRELRADDVDAIREYAEDDELHKYMLWQRDTREDTIAFLAACVDAARCEPRTEYNLAIDFDGRMIGTLGMSFRQHSACELGYVLRRDHWHKGLITEAAALLVSFAFDELKVHRIIAHCDPRNGASWRVMEKLGMRREGLLLEHLLIAGTWRDSLRYAILPAEWNIFSSFSQTARASTGLDVTLTRAAPREIADIHELMRIVGEDMRDRFGMDHWEKPWPLEHMQFDAARRETYAIRDANEIIASFTIGFDSIWFNENFLPWAPATRPLYLNRLMTHPKYQSSGIGALMMRAAEDLGRARGCDFLRLETRTDFTEVRRFYDRLGYELRYEDEQNPWCALDKRL